MISEIGLLKEFNLISKSGNRIFTGGIPCEWKGDEEGFKVDPKAFLSCSLLSLLISGSQLSYVIHLVITARIQDTPVEMSNFAIPIVMVPGFLLLAYFSFRNYREPQEFEGFINEIVKLERNDREKLARRGHDVPNKLGRGRGNLAKVALMTCQTSRTSTALLLPPVMALGSVIIPGIPANHLRFYPTRLALVAAEGIGGKVGSPWLGFVLGKVVTFGVNLWYGQVTMIYWCLLVAQIVTGCVGLSIAISALEGEMQNSTGKNDDFVRLLVTHKQINIISERFNKLSSTTLVLLLLHVANAQVFCAWNLFGKADATPLGNTDISTRLFLSSVLLNSVIGVLVIFGFCGDVHHTSTKCLNRMKANVRGAGGMAYSKIKNYKRMVRSLQTVKIRFGGMNFIEKITPVIFEQFALAKLADCLLLSQRPASQL